MHVPNFLQVLLEGTLYDVLKHMFWQVLGALAMTGAAQYVIKHGFNKLKKRQEVVAFCGGAFVLFFFLLFSLDQRPLQQEPRLVASIQQAITGDGFQDRDTIAVFALNLINTGTMQTIIKNWRVEAEASGRKYDAYFAVPPASFTFNNIPKTSSKQPDSLTFKSVDNIIEKSLTPIQVGALLPGTLFVVFENVDRAVFKMGVTFNVSFEDVLSKKYSASIKTSGRADTIGLVPGLHTEAAACVIPPGGLPKIGSDLLKKEN